MTLIQVNNCLFLPAQRFDVSQIVAAVCAIITLIAVVVVGMLNYQVWGIYCDGLL